jgi:3-methyl-2-oxobutanoate hydroxymethyltransferase
VCAHIGLTPQSVHQLGGYGIQGRDAEGAQRLLNDARALETAGAAMIVLEAIPADLAARITQSVAMPTIGIGAGRACDGQVLVLQDMLGIYPRPSPKFSRNFMEGAAGIEAAVRAYVAAVKSGEFPDAAHTVA